jgi:hypothetical protein
MSSAAARPASHEAEPLSHFTRTFFMSMRAMVASIEGEYRRYKGLAEGAIEQVAEADLCRATPDDNSIAVVVWHISGNLTSRFTEFLTSDGEKPSRSRDEEFETRQVSRLELRTKWECGWSILFGTVSAPSDADLDKTVTIRQQPLKVYEALHRSLAHTEN